MKIRLIFSPLVIMGIFLTLTITCKKVDNNDPSKVTDIDGNVYRTVMIGTQVWMVENLKTTKYRDGSAIPNVADNIEWSMLTTGGYCNYQNVANNSITYGRLYNWYAVYDSRNIAPTGWHVPTDAEWATLMNYLITNGYNYDGTTTENKIAKSLASTTLWESSTNPGSVGNTDYPTCRNITGFTALPAGQRSYGGIYGFMGTYGNWFSATEYDTDRAWCFRVASNLSRVTKSYYDLSKKVGFSVRCVKD